MASETQRNTTSVTSKASNFLSTILDWSLGGIDFSFEGNGGIECRDHVSVQRRVQETFIGVGVAVGLYVLNKWWSTSKKSGKLPPERLHSTGKTIPAHSTLGLYLLTSLCFIFGMEVAYKVATKQLIWLLNPCHVTSMVQIYLLTSEATAFNNKVFQMNLHFIHGPLAAMLFPTTHSLILPFEAEVYWIQHILIVIIPFYLMSSISPSKYQAHSPFQMGIFTEAFLAWSFYHWVVMQWLSFLTLANVGSMLCPAISDPFSGPDYRLYGIFHQSLAIFLFGTVMAFLSPGKLLASGAKED